MSEEQTNMQVNTNDFLATLREEVSRLTLENLFLKTVIRDKEAEIQRLSVEPEDMETTETS